jgi:hypothetical protein
LSIEFRRESADAFWACRGIEHVAAPGQIPAPKIYLLLEGVLRLRGGRFTGYHLRVGHFPTAMDATALGMGQTAFAGPETIIKNQDFHGQQSSLDQQ